MIVLLLGFGFVAVIVYLLINHFAPAAVSTAEAKVTAALPKNVQTAAIDASIALSNAAEKATAGVVKVELLAMRKWFPAELLPHIDALDAQNEKYLTGAA